MIGADHGGGTADKCAYYQHGGMRRQLAERYYHEFGPGARLVLGVGCGTGEFGRYQPRPHIEVLGVDADPGAIEAADRYERAHRIELESQPLPFDDGTFDAALVKDIFKHVQYPGRPAAEICQAIRLGDVLMASMVIDRPSRVWADYTHVRGFTRASARMLLEDAGFRVTKMWLMGGVPLSSRLGLIPLVPHLLRLPLAHQLWAFSWEISAMREG